MIHPSMILHTNAVVFIRHYPNDTQVPVLVTSVGIRYVSGYALEIRKSESGEELVTLGHQHSFDRGFIERLYAPDEHAPFNAEFGFSQDMLISVVKETPNAKRFLTYIRAEEAAD